MRIKFTRDWDHVETAQTVAYRNGDELTVTKEVAEAAIAAGAASEVVPEKPKPAPEEDG